MLCSLRSCSGGHAPEEPIQECHGCDNVISEASGAAGKRARLSPPDVAVKGREMSNRPPDAGAEAAFARSRVRTSARASVSGGPRRIESPHSNLVLGYTGLGGMLTHGVWTFLIRRAEQTGHLAIRYQPSISTAHAPLIHGCPKRGSGVSSQGSPVPRQRRADKSDSRQPGLSPRAH